MFGLSEAVAGSFGFGQQHMSYDQQKRMQSRQYNMDKGMAEYAYSKELEQWHRANLYNAPTSQMARLRAAGLNPNLVYGQSSGGAAGQATQLPKYQAPRFPDSGSLNVPGLGASGAMNMLSGFVNMAVQKKQMDKLQADKELVEAKAVNEVTRTPGIRGKSEVDSELGKWARDYARGKALKMHHDSNIAQLKEHQGYTLQQVERDMFRSRAKLVEAQAMRESEEYRRYRQFGLTSSDAIQWRAALNALRLIGVDLGNW